jgi:hypothetical protein
MAYTKKISGPQFAFDCIQKELDIVGSGLTFATYDEMVEWQKEHRNWFQEYEFKTLEQFLEWRNYFAEHFYDWKPKRITRREMRDCFNYFNLQYGLKYGFDYNDIPKDYNKW